MYSHLIRCGNPRARHPQFGFEKGALEELKLSAVWFVASDVSLQASFGIVLSLCCSMLYGNYKSIQVKISNLHLHGLICWCA